MLVPPDVASQSIYQPQQQHSQHQALMYQQQAQYMMQQHMAGQRGFHQQQGVEVGQLYAGQEPGRQYALRYEAGVANQNQAYGQAEYQRPQGPRGMMAPPPPGDLNSSHATGMGGGYPMQSYQGGPQPMTVQFVEANIMGVGTGRGGMMAARGGRGGVHQPVHMPMNQAMPVAQYGAPPQDYGDNGPSGGQLDPEMPVGGAAGGPALRRARGRGRYRGA